MVYFVRAVAAVNAGDLDSARQNLEMLAALEMKLNVLNWSEKAQDVMVLELKALIQRAEGNLGLAIESLTQAALIEYGMPRRSGPPWPPKPSHELLGELMAERGDHGAAKEQFILALSLARGRSKSLMGLARSASALGQDEDARRAYAALVNNWAGADTEFSALSQARANSSASTSTPAR